MNSLKKGEGVPLSNFEVSPGVPLLNFRGVPGPTFKLWEASRVPSSRVSRSRVPGFWSHFYTMTSQLNYFKIFKTIATRNNYFKTKHLTFFVKFATNLGKYIFTPSWNVSPRIETHIWYQFFQPGLGLKVSPRGEISRVTVL